MKEFTTTITPQCEVTLPDEVRCALGVELGDMVRFTIDGDKVSLSSAAKSSEAADKQAKAEKTARDLNDSTSDNPGPKPPFRVKPNPSGFVEGIDHKHLNRLLDDLDVEEFLAKNAE